MYPFVLYCFHLKFCSYFGQKHVSNHFAQMPKLMLGNFDILKVCGYMVQETKSRFLDYINIFILKLF